MGISACDDGRSASAAACEAFIGINQGFSADEPDPAAISSLLDTLDDNRPRAVSDELPVMIAAGREVVRTQEFTAFATPEFVDAEGAAGPFMFEHCDVDEKIVVTATDFEFAGMPESVEAGEVGFLLDNRSTAGEFHEVVIVRRNDDVDEPFDELLTLPDDELAANVTIVGATSAPAGARSATWVDLSPGHHALVCPIPQGTSMPGAEGNGPAHFALGMLNEFTVT